ncbi:uncharacterized protein BYT42DRAFT_545695 [Radiomyces spectabilis]|uniref:uncharacterized protein n=1 Tax=Radiomyces spectabilis TaxID=64574 RepID=UPI00221ED6F2|nr:uncharacterized protein BYT42DRAFT_545695 [Radiomyces spectabilis]KAI8379323.1 hypothetical protein BYT42DRAFT_545695 [Radiomyces spectabilis]
MKFIASVVAAFFIATVAAQEAAPSVYTTRTRIVNGTPVVEALVGVVSTATETVTRYSTVYAATVRTQENLVKGTVPNLSSIVIDHGILSVLNTLRSTSFSTFTTTIPANAPLRRRDLADVEAAAPVASATVYPQAN